MKQNTRHLKIFISSTFQDMQEERKILLKDIFLELKKIAKERDVEVTEIDLRWGITKNVADSGKTVKVCLDEIERCKDSPICFLGMIGNRYGWIEWFDDMDSNLLKDNRYAWVSEYKDKSITELEIRSVLDKNETKSKVLLYFKEDNGDKNPLIHKLKNELSQLCEKKENIEVNNYGDTNEFRKKVKADLYRLFDNLYPSNSYLTEQEKLYATHNSFAKERQALYVSCAENYNRMDNFLQGNHNLAVFFGKEGTGTSSFIANYFDDYNSPSILTYYIGCCKDENHLRNVIKEITILTGISQTKNIDNSSLDNRISDFLINILESTKEIVIVIDGIDKLEDEEKNIFLYHFLEEFEGKKTLSKVIITSQNKLNQFSLNCLLEPMIIEDKKSLISQYLSRYGKKLDDRQLELIVDHQNLDNNYFLMVILNEIRLLGNYENLEKDIKYYLSSTDTVKLFEKIFVRLEDDYGYDTTQNFLSFIYLARDGLSEDELFGLLSSFNNLETFTRLDFSPLFLTLEPHLSNTNGVYTLKNAYIRNAVKYKYLSIKENQIRTNLAQYFWKKNASGYDLQRAYTETVYQVYKSENEFELKNILLMRMTFYYLIEFDRDMLYVYMNSFDDRKFIKDVYMLIMEENYTPSILCEIASFMSFDLGVKDYALDILYRMEEVLIESGDGDTAAFARCYEDMSEIYQYNAKKWGDDEALELSQKYATKAVAYAQNDSLFVSSKEYNEAKNYEYSGNFEDKGLNKYISSIRHKEKNLGNRHEDVIADYRNLGNICRKESLYGEADKFYTIAWERSKELFGTLSKETYLIAGNIAELYLTYAKPLRSREESIASLEEKHGKLSIDTLQDFEKKYIEKVGWENEDYDKLLEVSKLLLKSTHIYEGKIDNKIYGYLAQAYRGVGDMKNFNKYYTLREGT